MKEAEHATVQKDYAGAKLGMWLFLYTEILLFGGLFVLYSVYLQRYPREFAAAAADLNIVLGAVNTVILLTGSLLVAISITALRRGSVRLAQWMLWGSVLTGIVFLINKYIEWSAEISHGIYPGSPILDQKENGEIIFFGLYYITLGLHGLHVLIGAVLLAFMAVYVATGSVHRDDFIKLENTGLYWHLVDLVWIFIFPLYYLLL
ncbi:cytochrome c oxidase subunit 3 family protein [Desulfuromonas sp. TF]|jgi:cytochrome c oxidase subunit 3|uniref:cytochrome c oxidase subunit 3 family protein n=1 Tax=Desulfuromonas sp. TF TaxID=1232410 RepID=UPI00041112A1|nr:cytochrome c oxidase subunit 3 family protein [Desulfuromonas sp. TF]